MVSRTKKENPVLILGSVLYDAKNYEGDLEIPDTVKTINAGAFSYNKQLRTIVVPNSVESIGSNAFSGCSNLTSIDIPNSVTEIGAGAFYSCDNLEEIVLPNKLKTISQGLFEECTSLKKVVIPDSVTVIEPDSFRVCESLEVLEIPKSVKRIDGDFSEECPWIKNQLKKSPMLIINNNLILVGNLTEENGEKIVITKGVKRISRRAFRGSGTTYIRKIEIPNTVTAIGTAAFTYKRIKTIELPNSVKYMGESVFSYCSELSQVKLSERLKVLPEDTFWGCKSLKQITIPESITKLEMDPFVNCNILKDFVFSSKMKSVELAAFTNAKGIVIHAPKGSYMETVAKKANVTFKPLAINKTKAKIKKKGTVQLNIATDTTYTTWKSSNSSIASVNSAGKVTGKKKGTATITGVLYGKKYSCKVTVR